MSLRGGNGSQAAHLERAIALLMRVNKYLLNTGLLLLRSGRMGVVATDGGRLSLVEVEEDSLGNGEVRKVLMRASA